MNDTRSQLTEDQINDRRARQRDYYARNREKRLLAVAEYRRLNKDKAAASVRAAWEKNGAAYRERERAWRQRDDVKAAKRVKNRDYARKRSSSDPAYRLRMRMSCLMRVTLRKSRKSDSTLRLIGCSIDELKSHFERQFLPGMSWGNMGDWHIDHIIPISSFNITGTDCEEFRRAWALSNLRPMWARDNLRKGSKIETLL